MRKTLLLLSLFIVTNAIGQTILDEKPFLDIDAQRLSSRDIDGTARYIGMAGAMTAIGGDPSAVMDNPAGLGLYRHSEIMTSFAIRPETNQQIGSSEQLTQTHLDVKQLSAVFAMTKPYRTSGVVANNLMIGFQRMKTFDTHYTAFGKDKGFSLTGLAADWVSGVGVTDEDLTRESYPESANDWYNNEQIGWMSGLMRATHLIDPDPNRGADGYHGIIQNDTTEYHTGLEVQEEGHTNHFSIDYSMNVSNRFYWGIGMNLTWLDYYKKASYVEAFGQESYEVTSYISQKGVGVNGTIGVLYRPVQAFRIGASFQTPTILRLNQAFDGEILSDLMMQDTTGQVKLTTFDKVTPYVYRDQIDKFVTPMRLSISPAIQIGSYALIAFQYDYSHWKNCSDVHTFKVGVEGAIRGSFMLEAGYAYSSSFWKEDEVPCFQHYYNSVRLDTDWKNIFHQHYASVGLGYHGDAFIAHLAYQCRWQHSDVSAHEWALPLPMRTVTHNIVLSIAWHSL